MASEVLFDTSGFFALMDSSDAAHTRAVTVVRGRAGKMRPVSTEWIIGETCTLLVARHRSHLVAGFLDYLERSTALLVVNPDAGLLASAKGLIRRQAEAGYSFVDCLSFCLMRERRILQALTADAHFRRAGFDPLLT
jgi:predicted nucleic acid-binding protein